jgi:hypothetical protein
MDSREIGAAGRLPNLIVIGVPKSGTGSLFGWLSQHPDICPGDEKEIGYFNHFNPRRHTGPVPPLEEYARHFTRWGDERYAFEATPTYSYGGRPVIDAIRETLPGVRIILTLRNPTDRLWSAYTFQRELGNLEMPFEEYLATCESRSRDGSDLVPRDHFHGLYIGYYADYVPLWLDAFGDDLRVLFADDLRHDAPAVMAGVFRWLGIDDTVVSGLDLAPRNRTNHPRSVRAARLAYSVKRSAERMGVLSPRLRATATRLYQRTNRGTPPEQMSAELRRHVDELYLASNATTAAALREHGYDRLPPWLATAGSPTSADEPAQQG